MYNILREKGILMSKDLDIDCFSAPLKKILPTENLPFSLYLFINNHFVLYRKKNTELDAETLRKLELKRCKYLFIEEDERHEYEKFLKDKASDEKKDKELQQALKSPLGKIRSEINRKFTEELEAQPIEKAIDNISKIASASAKALVEELSKKPPSAELLAKLTKHDYGLYGHVINVSTICIHVAQKLGYLQERFLEYLGTAALLHDIGKLRIDPSLISKSPGDFTEQEKKILRKHPNLGNDLLLSVYNMPGEIRLMVQQHHEHNDGSGYPNGLSGNRIYEPTKILTIVNTFEHFFQGIRVATKQGVNIETISKLMTSPKIITRFDTKLLRRCLDVLENF